MKEMTRITLLNGILATMVAHAVGCAGPEGPQGPAGQQGAPGAKAGVQQSSRSLDVACPGVLEVRELIHVPDHHLVAHPGGMTAAVTGADSGPVGAQLTVTVSRSTASIRVRAAQALGYRVRLAPGRPGFTHMRKNGARFWGRVFDVTAPHPGAVACSAIASASRTAK